MLLIISTFSQSCSFNNTANPIPQYYLQIAPFYPHAYKNRAARPPATAAKLMPTAAAPELPATELVAPAFLLVELGEDPEVEVALLIKVGLATAGFMVVELYIEQVALGAIGQESSMQMLWS
jgi:hypothetical protein